MYIYIHTYRYIYIYIYLYTSVQPAHIHAQSRMKESTVHSVIAQPKVGPPTEGNRHGSLMVMFGLRRVWF